MAGHSCLVDQLLRINVAVTMIRVKRNAVFEFPTRSDTNQAVQPKKMARGLKCRIYEVEGLYYLCSENSCALTVQLICGLWFMGLAY